MKRLILLLLLLPVVSASCPVVNVVSSDFQQITTYGPAPHREYRYYGGRGNFYTLNNLRDTSEINYMRKSECGSETYEINTFYPRNVVVYEQRNLRCQETAYWEPWS